MKKSLDILDQIREVIAKYEEDYNQKPDLIELGSAAYRRFAVHLASVQPKLMFEEVPVSLNWQIDAEEIVLTGE